MTPERRVDLELPRWQVRLFARWKKDHADDELMPVGQPPPGRDEAAEKILIGAQEQARAVAGVVDRAAAVLDAAEPGDRLPDHVVRRADEIDHGADAAAAAPRVVAIPLDERLPIFDRGW